MREGVEAAETVDSLDRVEGVGAHAGRQTPLPPLPPLDTEHSCPHCGQGFTIVNFVLPNRNSAGEVATAVDDRDVRNHYSAG